MSNRAVRIALAAAGALLLGTASLGGPWRSPGS